MSLKLFINEDMKYTKEMEEWFDKRTNMHIGLVQKYAKKIETLSKKFDGLSERAKDHDKTKFSKTEKIPYILISWDYHQKDKGKTFQLPDKVKDEMNKATVHHVKSNRHHPEFLSPISNINRENRDEVPDKIVDATRMTTMDIGEMVADWLAMSEEKNSNPNDWAKKNINTRWKFTKPQEKLIYDIIKKVWKG